MELDHSKRKHALLSASKASRWLNCTPSAKLEDQYGEEGSSVYAEEGTLAHEIAELYLRRALGQITTRSFNRDLKKLMEHELYKPEMLGHAEMYRDYLLEAIAEAKTRTPDPTILVEEKIDFSEIVAEGSGTGDSGLIADRVLEVVDYKYGKGVKVMAEKNDQLSLYALGLLLKYELAYDIQTVKLTIIQPRLGHIDSWTVPVADLWAWAENFVRPRAELAAKGEGDPNPGEWCRWCKVKAICRAFANDCMELAEKTELRDPELLTDEEMLEINSKIPSILDWADAVKEYMLTEALKGKTWPGLKLVAGRSVRKWIDESKVIETLKDLGYDEEKYMVSKLVGIPAVESLMGKPAFNKGLSKLVMLPPGKPTLVPESDKRPALGIEQARIDFTDNL